MRSGAIPFQFEIEDVLRGFFRSSTGHKSSVLLTLPFINVRVLPKTIETRVAGQLVIRASDRRVLSAQECCDGCINDALRSLQEIRAGLVNMQIEVLDVRDGPLYKLMELMLVGIRQFLTFEQRLTQPNRSDDPNFQADTRQAYFDGLELLRGHLSRCLGQTAVLAGLSVPADGLISGYQGCWPIDAYKPVDCGNWAN